MTKKIIIAIDGFSSTGKSTIAKQIAKQLSYIYVDTGAMYRAVTLYAMQKNYITNSSFDKQKLINDLQNIDLSFQFNNNLGFAEMYLNGENVEKEIRTLEVSKLVSKVSEVSEVRKKLVAAQQEMGKEKGIVMDGRDIGTVVFPNAELKLFMTASADRRATRRYKELLDKGHDVKFKDILFNVQERDRIDSSRKDSPLIKANDAVEIDNSDMGLKEQFNRIMSLVKLRIEQN
ncbi:(d)CMP kinase [Tenacibaculum sp. IB213877]|uniref:(d)CMP kinase n=1 Tax=Tenacibaculum sp. IB213877 TaxID=3097351 RepID=UPI002A59E936|nr:(d)CMP kinase [Tenacibaculum sp. IB213877]MDY0779736.1 (d)CMP kinase [Tenacibaculum sp. IB213877]